MIGAPKPIGDLLASNLRETPLDRERLRLREAARAFEAIMIRQLLASARAKFFTEATQFTGGGLSQFESLRDENYAEIASRAGAFGIAEMIEARLAETLKPRES